MKTDSATSFLSLVSFFYVGICLWFKILLPYSYFFGVASLGFFVILSLFQKKSSFHIMFQIFLLFFLINCVYSLSTHFSVIPYRDPCWDYAVAKTFLENNSVFTINTYVDSGNLLTWYSGWPLVHSVAVVLSKIMGVPLLSITIMFPMIISLCKFLAIYLILNRLREIFNFDKQVVYLGILIYVLNPDTLYWRMQFGRFDVGLLWICLLSLFLLILVSNSSVDKRKISLLTIFICFSLTITHHFSSFMLLLLLLLLFILRFFGNHLFQTGKWRNIIGFTPKFSTLYMGLVMLSFILLWWVDFGQVIWPTVSSEFTSFYNFITQGFELELYAGQTIYPNLLSNPLLLFFLRFRDALIYLPSILGLYLLIRKKITRPEKFFVLSIFSSFILLFMLNSFTFQMEIFRIPVVFSPFLAFTTAMAYNKIKPQIKRIWTIILPIMLLFLILFSFVGLWGHAFAPIHLYTADIKFNQIGENFDLSRVSPFIQKEVPLENLSTIWHDGGDELVVLLPSNVYYKVYKAEPAYLTAMGIYGQRELFCEFQDFGLYQYYSGVYSSEVTTPEDSEMYASILKEHIEAKFNRIYDDEQLQLWINYPQLD